MAKWTTWKPSGEGFNDQNVLFYTLIEDWTKAAKNMNYEPQKDPVRKNFFYATDAQGNVVGTFCTHPIWYHGVLFKSYRDRLAYER